MLKTQSSQSKLSKVKNQLKIQPRLHRLIAALCVTAAVLTLLASASAQADFTLQAAPFSPDAVAPGGTSSSNITIGAINGFTGTVALTCQVSSAQTTTSAPACAVSPTTVTPPAGATVTITTTAQTTTVSYAVTITGTGPSTTHTTTPLDLTVLAVTPQFTITVQSPVVPSSVPAGSGAEGVITINPINGYSSPIRTIGGDTIKGITLACTSITPLVTIPPVCSFTYPPGDTGMPVDGVPANTTITISTSGPIITSAGTHPQTFYALWFSFPMLALVGLGVAIGGKRARKPWGLLALLILVGALVLMPACANTTPQINSPNGVTPNNTYTFTIVGVDANGVVSSNITSGTSSNPTVTLTVTSATTP